MIKLATHGNELAARAVLESLAHVGGVISPEGSCEARLSTHVLIGQECHAQITAA